MRSPTAADTRRFLHLAKKHGVPTEVILPWLPERGKPGRRAHDDQLTSIELFVRVAMRDRNMSRHRALHWLYDNIFKGLGRLDHNDRSSAIIARFGRDADAAVARVRKKLRQGGFEKRPMESLVSQEWLELGVDPSRFTTS